MTSYNSEFSRDPSKRDYFYGIEVENTPAKGSLTLFIAGPGWDVHQIRCLLKEETEHIYLAANHSYAACDWVSIAQGLLDTTDLYVSVEQPVSNLQRIVEVQSDRFIPIISLVVDNVETINPNTCLKIDVDLQNITNPGVWVSPLKHYIDKWTFTPWSAYSKDGK